jgi:hypothetical protein
MGDKSPPKPLPSAHKRNRPVDSSNVEMATLKNVEDSTLSNIIDDGEHLDFVAKKPRDENDVVEFKVDEETRHSNDLDDDYDDEEDDDYDDLVNIFYVLSEAKYV